MIDRCFLTPERQWKSVKESVQEKQPPGKEQPDNTLMFCAGVMGDYSKHRIAMTFSGPKDPPSVTLLWPTHPPFHCGAQRQHRMLWLHVKQTAVCHPGSRWTQGVSDSTHMMRLLSKYLHDNISKSSELIRYTIKSRHVSMIMTWPWRHLTLTPELKFLLLTTLKTKCSFYT